MGRHHQRREHRIARITVGAGVVTAGVLQAAAPAIAAPSVLGDDADSIPCDESAKACVSISEQKAWLTDGEGHVIRGAVPITTGAEGYETPEGTFHVTWKDRYHVSQEYDRTSMPYSTFFAPGVALHGGSLSKESAGCVHLDVDDAKAFFTNLEVNDEVQVVS